MTQQGICPSIATLIQYKTQLFSAQKGHNLLKTKIEALKVRFRLNLDKLIHTRTIMFDNMKEASLVLSKTQFYNEKQLLYNTILNDIGKKAQIRIDFTVEHVAGVKSIQFKVINNNSPDRTENPYRQFPFIGLFKGGKQILLLQKTFQQIIEMLVRLASLQIIFATFTKAIKSTKCRVNGIEYVIIPKTITIINYILTELEERDREEFYRIKQICRKRVKQEKLKFVEQNIRNSLSQEIRNQNGSPKKRPTSSQPKIKIKKLNFFGN